MTTFHAKRNEVKQDWILVDVEDKVLGRVATEIAKRLRGKHRPQYTPSVDTGDFVVAVNAEKIRVTGNKGQQSRYIRHSGFTGGIRDLSFDQMIQRSPEEVLRIAVKGMLPKNSLGRQLLRKLKVYAGPEHPHAAQQPKPVEL